MFRVDYDQIAPEYNQRYASPELGERGQALLSLARALPAGRILEVGCGTAHWLSALQPVARQLVGLDFSIGMLRQARKREAPLELVHGSADHLPFGNGGFDLVYCVDAIHHFGDPAGFIARAFEILDHGGALAVIGLDPRNPKNTWYAYDYFEGMYATDLKRFPAEASVLEWMKSAGFEKISYQQVERLDESKTGRAVLNDPYLKKNSSSQLALLSDETYQAGIGGITTALGEAERRGETLVFRTVLCIDMITGYKTRS